MSIKRYKCHKCYTILNQSDLVEGKCPNCGSDKDNFLEDMCELDHVCTCKEIVQHGTQECPVCKRPVCKCGSHDVFAISRVTGYLQDVGGWNQAKLQELRDRKRYTIE